MKKLILSFLLLAAHSLSAGAEEINNVWTEEDTISEVAIGALFVIDEKQTKEIFRLKEMHVGTYYEKNPLIHKDSITGYFIGTYLVQVTAAYLLPAPSRHLFQAGIVALEVTTTARNKYIGIHIKF